MKIHTPDSCKKSGLIRNAQAILDISNLESGIIETDTPATQLHICNNLPDLPLMYQNIMTNENILKHLSDIGIREFYNSNYNLKKLQNIIVNGNPDFNSTYLESFKLYIQQLEFSRKMVVLESERLRDGISDQYLLPLYQKLNEELIGIDHEEFEGIMRNSH